MKLRIKLSVPLLFICAMVSAQMKDYRFKREISGVKDQWHKLVLPDLIFGNVNENLNDIRIYGITSSNDTIEVPYIIRESSGKISSKEVPLKALNASHNDNGYYYTYEIASGESVNRIELGVNKENFEWNVDLEASQDLKEWFKITENYRLLAIKHDQANFKFTTISFPDSKQRYYRVLIKSKIDPEITSAKVSLNDTINGKYKEYEINGTLRNDEKSPHLTVIDIELKVPVPVSCLSFKVEDAIDFYRPVSIEYLVDSFKTEKGWKYNYNQISSDILNSADRHAFLFNSVITNRLKLIIHNRDNLPLKIDSFRVKGYVHELIARFDKKANYFLVYGNDNSSAPEYDISRFSDNIPIQLTELNLGDEVKLDISNQSQKSPLFENKIWLWTIMGLIILVLGWFSLKMINNKSEG